MATMQSTHSHPGCKCPTSCDTASQDTPWHLSQSLVPPIDRESCTHTAIEGGASSFDKSTGGIPLSVSVQYKVILDSYHL